MLAAPMARAGSAIGGCAAAINAPMSAEAVGGVQGSRRQCWSDPGDRSSRRRRRAGSGRGSCSLSGAQAYRAQEERVRNWECAGAVIRPPAARLAMLMLSPARPLHLGALVTPC